MGSYNMTFQAVYSSKYIPVLYSNMYNNLKLSWIILYSN